VRAASGFHNNRNDHRSTFRPFVDKPPGRATNLSFERLDISDAVSEGSFDRRSHRVTCLIEKIFSLWGIHPPAGDDLRTSEHRPRLHIDRHHNDDNTFFGERPSVANDTSANVANDAVDVDIPGGNPVNVAGAIAIKQQHITVFAQQHSIVRETHDSTESGVRNKVSVFPVYGNKPLGLHD
jgi:hypothetical protein